jgi:hypothetical protein
MPKTFVDTGTGRPVLPVLCHFGEAFSAFVRRPADVADQCRVIKAAGYLGIRFWDVLGYYDSAWKGREVTPVAFTNRSGQRVEATPDYYGQLDAFLAMLRDLGLVTHHSRGDLNSIPFAQVCAHTQRVAESYDRVGHQVCALAEGNNEDWQNGNLQPDRLRQAVAPFAARGILTGLSCPEGASEEPSALAAYSQGASVWVVHGYRQGEYYDRIRHIVSLALESPGDRPRLGWQGEPSGPGDGVTVGQTNDANVLQMMAVAALMFRQAWTYMSSFGVFWNGRIETQPGFAEVPQAVAWLPIDVQTFSTVCHGGTRWKGTRVYAVPGTDQTRADHAINSDGRFCCLMYGPRWRECYAERPHRIEQQVDFGDKGRLVIGRV